MKRIFLLLLLLQSAAAMAQETSIKGMITNGNTPLESAHILNLSEQKQTISDLHGKFTLTATQGDTLLVTFLGYRDLSFRVTTEQLSKEENVLIMTEKGIPLDEVTLEQNKSLDAVALGLISKRPEKRTSNERKLEEAGDFKATQLLNILGGGVPIIPMLNKITGRTKRLKQRVAVERENILKEYLQYHYTDFIKKRLALKEEEIDRFLYYAVINHGWDDLHPGGNKEQFQFRLIQVYQDFSRIMEEEGVPEIQKGTAPTGG